MECYVFHPDAEKLVGVPEEARIALSYAELSEKYLKEPKSCVIAAGNSFGIMDGGLDKAMIDVHGIDLQNRVQEKIAMLYDGELPVGHAVTVPIWDNEENEDCPMLIYSPTMQVPMSIEHTSNVYYAMREALYIARILKCEKLYIPLMGCGAGGLTPECSIRQISAAMFSTKPVNPCEITWDFAFQRHYLIHEITNIHHEHSGGELNELDYSSKN